MGHDCSGRRPGVGRKSITQSDPELVQALEGLIDEQTRGEPESALRWICTSTRAIARQLGERNLPISHVKVAQILHDLDSLLPLKVVGTIVCFTDSD